LTQLISNLLYYSQLPEMLGSLPKKNCKFRILPQLINAIKYGSGGSKAIIPIFQIGEMMTQEEFKEDFIPKILDLFESSDRTVRVNLLKNLGTIMPHLTVDHVEQRVYPHVAKGFRDSSPILREMTVKSMIEIVPKLSENTVTENVVRYLWALQGDKEPAIRTNTIIALGKLARNFNEKTRKRILLAAFARSLKDPFVHSRVACLKALVSTKDLYTPAELAIKALPAVTPLAVDPNKGVRDLAFQCIHAFLEVLSATSNSTNFENSSGIDPVGPNQSGVSESGGDHSHSSTGANGVSIHTGGTNQNDAGYLGWAVSSVSSLKSKIVGEQQSNIGADINIKKTVQPQPQQPTQPQQTQPTQAYQAPNYGSSTASQSNAPATNKSNDIFADSSMIIRQPPVQNTQQSMKLNTGVKKAAEKDMFSDFESFAPNPQKKSPSVTPTTTTTTNAPKQQPAKNNSLNFTPYSQQTAFSMADNTKSNTTVTAPPKQVNPANQMNSDNDFNFSDWDDMLTTSNTKPIKNEEDFFNDVMHNDDDIFGLGPPKTTQKPKSATQPQQQQQQRQPQVRTTQQQPNRPATSNTQKQDLFQFAPPKSDAPSRSAPNTTKQPSAKQNNNSSNNNKRQVVDSWDDFSWDDMPSN
jgi:hypothetical protein